MHTRTQRKRWLGGTAFMHNANAFDARTAYTHAHAQTQAHGQVDVTCKSQTSDINIQR